jgi:NADH-quinone oxidoreductase subunit C
MPSEVLKTSQTVTNIEQLKDHPALSILLGSMREAVLEAKWDRNELSIVVAREFIRDASEALKPEYNYLSDLTCTDWAPNEPRFQIIYHLLSHKRKDRVRLKVKLAGDDATVESIYSVWPGCNYFEREVFDLFGIRFLGHPNLRRILMPEDWDGHPLRKDYPVEGYR